ncbi:MAG: rhodanese-like domain-containing protein [Planctomycetota bacterium]
MPTLRASSLSSVAALLFIALAVIAPGCAKRTTDADIRPISLSQVRALIAEAEETPDRRVLLLIDPRAPSKFIDGHLPLAKNVQLSDVPAEPRRPEIDTFDHVVVYGDHTSDAAAIAMTKRLLAGDYNEPKMFRGGLRSWRAAGLEVERGGAVPRSSARP